MNRFPDLSVAILAGGKSRRMGHDKGLLHFREKPVILHVIDIAKKISESIFIISNNLDYQIFEFPLFNDHFNDAGPLGGLHAALENCPTERCLILACDMPFLKAEMFYHMAQHQTFQTVVPVHGDMEEPLCGIYSRSTLPAILSQIEEKKLKMTDFIEQTNHFWYQVDENSEFYHPDLFTNLNTPEDWKQKE
jgi:molybdopterin-guanine dinucleotide biosynthesis protein A